MSHLGRFLGATALTPWLLGCSLVGDSSDHEQLDAYARRRAVEQAAFDAESRDLARRSEFPTEIEFPGAGAVYVRDCRLLGWPEKAYLKLEFTYANTTDKTLRQPRMVLVVTDPDTGEESRGWLDLVMPFALRLTPNSTYTASIEAPAMQIYRRPNWGWRIELELADEGGGTW